MVANHLICSNNIILLENERDAKKRGKEKLCNVCVCLQSLDVNRNNFVSNNLDEIIIMEKLFCLVNV